MMRHYIIVFSTRFTNFFILAYLYSDCNMVDLDFDLDATKNALVKRTEKIPLFM